MPRPRLKKPSRADLAEQATRAANMRQLYQYMSGQLRGKGYQTRYRVHPYPDGSIDGELIVQTGGEDTDEVVTDIADAFDVSGQLPPDSDIMASVMLSRQVERGETVTGYEVRKGIAAVQSHYTRTPVVAPVIMRLLSENITMLQETEVRLRLWWAPGAVRRRKDW